MARVGMFPSGRRGRIVRAVLVAVCLAVAGTTVGVAPVGAEHQLEPRPTPGVDLKTWLLSFDTRGAAGAPMSVGVKIDNFGTDTATNLSLVVTLPDDAQFLGTGELTNYCAGDVCGLEELPPGSCTASGGTVTCGLGELSSNSGMSFSIDLRFDEVGTFVLTSSATADQPDADGDSENEIELVVVEEEADLEVVDESERVVTGAAHEVRHSIRNNGPTDAAQVSVTGTFPLGAQVDPDSLFFGHGPYDPINQADALCTTTATGFACGPLPRIGDHGSALLTYEIVVDVPGTLESTVTVTGRNDPDTTNNTGTLTLTFETPLALIWPELVVGGMAAGQPSSVMLETFNHGDGVAEDVIATIEVPAGWTVTLPSVPEEGRSCEGGADGRLVRCTYESIPPGRGRYLEVLVTPPSGSGTGTVVGTVETASPDFGTKPKSHAEEVPFSPSGADMVAVSADHDPEVPASGASSTVTWRFRNETPERLVEDVRFSVSMPPGTRATHLEQGSPGNFSRGCDLDPLDRNPSCTVEGLSSVDEFEFILGVEYERGGTFPFTATVSQASEEQAPGDETLNHAVEVETATADLQLSVRPLASEVTVGDTYSYVATVRNDGPHEAADVVVADELPAGTELVSATRGWFGKACDLDGARYECRIRRTGDWSSFEGRPLTPGTSTFVVVTVRATDTGPLASAPTVTATQVDPDLESNTAPVTVEAVEAGGEPAVDLVLTRHADDDPLLAGAVSNDVYVIENRSARAATGVTLHVDDGEAANIEVLGAAFGWFGRSCATTATTTCNVPTIPAGGTQFVVVETRPRQPGAVDTTASVSADQPDADPTTNTIALTGDAAPAPTPDGPQP